MPPEHEGGNEDGDDDVCMCGGPGRGCVCNADPSGRASTAGLDPVTCEPLRPPHPQHPFVLARDGTTALCYNESTLRRIAEGAGAWLQPPHFRTPMEPALVARCEALGGPLQSRGGSSSSGAARRLLRSAYDLDDEDRAWVYERFVGRLRATRVYVCPSCLARLHAARLAAAGAAAPPPSRDPLEVVLSHGPAGAALFCSLARRAWTQHMREVHDVGARDDAVPSAEDCTLKQMVYSWLGSSDPATEQYKSSALTVCAWDTAAHQRVSRVAVAQQADVMHYWRAFACLNTARYNELVDALSVHETCDAATAARALGTPDDDVQRILFESSGSESDGSDDWIVDDLGSHPYNRGHTKSKSSHPPSPLTSSSSSVSDGDDDGTSSVFSTSSSSESSSSSSYSSSSTPPVSSSSSSSSSEPSSESSSESSSDSSSDSSSTSSESGSSSSSSSSSSDRPETPRRKRLRHQSDDD